MKNKEEQTAPKLRFKGYTDAWQQRRLNIITTAIKDGTHASFHSTKYGPYLLSAKNIQNNKLIITSEDRHISNEDFNYINKYFEPMKNDVLLTIVGTVGRVASLSETPSNIAFQRSVAFLRPNSKYLSSCFFKNLLLTSNFQNNLKRNQVVSAQPGIYLNDLSNISLWISNEIKEQENISNVLDKINNILTLLQRKLDKYKNLKHSLLDNCFTQKNNSVPILRFNDFTKKWEEIKSEKIFDTITDYVANGSFKTLRKNVRSYSSKNFAYLIRLQDASNNWNGPWLYTDFQGYSFLKKSRLMPNDIVMSNVGSVGKVFQVPKLDLPMTLAPNTILLRSSNHNTKFLFMLLNSNYGQTQIKRITSPGVQNKINKTDFRQLNFKIPEIEEEKEIGNLLSKIDYQLFYLQNRLEKYSKFKKFLLQNMFI